MFFKIYNKEFPNEILITSSIFQLFGTKDHFIFNYINENNIFIKSINGDSDMCKLWQPYDEEQIYNIFFSDNKEYIECSLEKFNKMKVFI